MLVLKQNIIRKEQINVNTMEFNINNNKKYKIEVIWNSILYAKELVSNNLLALFYLILWKKYLNKKNI